MIAQRPAKSKRSVSAGLIIGRSEEMGAPPPQGRILLALPLTRGPRVQAAPQQRRDIPLFFFSSRVEGSLIPGKDRSTNRRSVYDTKSELPLTRGT